MNNKITPTPWQISQFKEMNIGINYDSPLEAETICQVTGNNARNANAIVSAVNGTYGKLINPEAVGDLLESVKELVESWDDSRMELHELIEHSRKVLEKAIIK